jgi:uncharacterized membrane protein YbaN (DUF454 family)
VKAAVKRWLILGVGWFFVIAGLAGLFLPFLQGILFLLIGLAILARESEWAHNLLHRLRRRFPKISAQFDQAEAKALAWVRRLSGRVRETCAPQRKPGP